MGFLGDITGGLLGESSGEKASKKARALSAAAKKETMAELGESWENISGWLTPYLETGTEALATYKESIGAAPDAPVFDQFTFDYTKMEENPAYQFVREQGLRAQERIAAKNRALGSGQRITAATEYATGLASQEYENEFRRQLQTTQEQNRIKALQFGAESDVYGRRMQDLGYLTQAGQTAGTNLASFRERLAGSRTGAITGAAAEQTAAMLIPVQEKQAFVSNLMQAAGTAAGGM